LLENERFDRPRPVDQKPVRSTAARIDIRIGSVGTRLPGRARRMARVVEIIAVVTGRYRYRELANVDRRASHRRLHHAKDKLVRMGLGVPAELLDDRRINPVLVVLDSLALDPDRVLEGLVD